MILGFLIDTEKKEKTHQIFLLFFQIQKKQNLADPSVRKRFVTYKEATELYSMWLTRIQEHAKIAGATYKMGNKVLLNTDIFEAYLEQFSTPGDHDGMAKKFPPEPAGLKHVGSFIKYILKFLRNRMYEV